MPSHALVASGGQFDATTDATSSSSPNSRPGYLPTPMLHISVREMAECNTVSMGQRSPTGWIINGADRRRGAAMQHPYGRWMSIETVALPTSPFSLIAYTLTSSVPTGPAR